MPHVHMHPRAAPAVLARIGGTGLILIAVLAPHSAAAGAILVGKTPGVCTEYTLEDAIDRANELDGYNLIIVTDDVPSGEYRENAHVGDLKEGLQLDIRGGYRSCIDPTPTGQHVRIRGASTGEPVLRLGGSAARVSMRGLHISGGSSGIEIDGQAKVELWTDENGGFAVTGNRDDGIRMHFTGGDNAYARPELSILGHVQIFSNGASGIRAYDKARIIIRSMTASISGNGGHGIELHGGAQAEVAGSGRTLSSNAGYGLWIDSDGPYTPTGGTSVYSLDAAIPLEISDNHRGALHLEASTVAEAHDVCFGRIAIHDNHGDPIVVDGPGANLSIDNASCGTAQPPSAPPSLPPRAGAIVGNRADASLITAIAGGGVVIRNAWVADNTASSLLSANPDGGSALSALTLTDSVVTANSIDDSLFESREGGVVDVWDSSVFGNGGSFASSFMGVDPALLQATNSIVDQPQALAAIQGAAEGMHFTRVLAPNRDGAGSEDDILLGQARYRDEFGQLAIDSPGVDYGLAGGGIDFVGYPRDVDVPGVANTHGPRDLGAYEVPYNLDYIFLSGFD